MTTEQQSFPFFYKDGRVELNQIDKVEETRRFFIADDPLSITKKTFIRVLFVYQKHEYKRVLTVFIEE